MQLITILVIHLVTWINQVFANLAHLASFASDKQTHRYRLFLRVTMAKSVQKDITALSVRSNRFLVLLALSIQTRVQKAISSVLLVRKTRLMIHQEILVVKRVVSSLLQRKKRQFVPASGKPDCFRLKTDPVVAEVVMITKITVVTARQT